ncbi:MAG: hypothetical protein LBQ98_03860 [Nitrososphaerota archaeon]|nr:hypothetical protein [Nitrososphaerota archaeon]
MVKVYNRDGKEESFERKKVEDDLKAVGLPQRMAEEVAERLEVRVQDGWTADKIRDETDIELRHLQEAIDKAHACYKGATPMGTHNVGEQRTLYECDSSIDIQPRSETRVECRNIET